MIQNAVAELVKYGYVTGLLEAEDRIWAANALIRELGAEHTDMVLASKNKDVSVMKREIADYMISLMKIMDKRDITWEDIADEISRREESRA